jgi:hypothetical protein
VTYCPGSLTRQEIESVNFEYASLEAMTKKYNPEKLEDGFNTVDDEEIFFIMQTTAFPGQPSAPPLIKDQCSPQ